MAEGKRRYKDKRHQIADEYYALCEYADDYPEDTDTDFIKKELKDFIKRDPDFLDPYVWLYNILEEEGKVSEAEKFLNEAYERALRLITDEKGNWPDKLEWGWLENRHIIRTLLNKGLHLWKIGENDSALDLFRKLLKTNPMDNVGARVYILAIRTGMSFEEFEDRFERDGDYDDDLMKWFEENYKRFPEEFEEWEEAFKRMYNM